MTNRNRDSAAGAAQSESAEVGLQWLAEHGDRLYAYAVRRVGSSSIAEDLVQETFLAAIRSADRFSGKSSRRTWLIGILKHKLLDHYRHSARGRERVNTDLDSEPGSRSNGANATGRGEPEAADPFNEVCRQELQQTLVECIDELPARLRQAFTLRAVDRLETEQAAAVLGISKPNLAARLYRARLLLRDCIERWWP